MQKYNLLIDMSNLKNEYENFMETKKNFLNNHKIMEYLFNKPIKKIKYLDDILINYDSSPKIVKVTDVEESTILTKLFIMNELLLRMEELNINTQLKIYSDLSKTEKYIYYYLHKINTRYPMYKCDFIFKWDFFQKKNDEKFIFEKKYIKLPHIRCDFLGILINENNNRLIIFAIEYDGKSHFGISNKIHINDIIKQYYLFQMNVHLLRLNNTLHIKNEIFRFIDLILNGNEYVILNAITPKHNLFNHIKINYIESFYENYNYNHILFIRLPYKEIDEDLEYDDIINEPNYINHDPNVSYYIHNIDFKNIKKTKILIPIIKNSKEADNIIVELIKNKK